AAVRSRVLSRRSFRNKSSKDIAFPHPESRKEHYRNDDKPNLIGVLWNFFKRTINVAQYRNAKDDVNPAKNRTFGGIFHDYSSSIYFRLFSRAPCLSMLPHTYPCRFIHLDSRLLSILRRSVGRFATELHGILRVQSLPAAELHCLGANDAADRSSAEKVIQNIETNVPSGST